MNMHKVRLAALLVIPLVAILSGCVAAVVGGAGTAAVLSEDRRTVGTVTEDQGIEFKAESRIRDKYKDAHINLTSYSRMVLITGHRRERSSPSGCRTPRSPGLRGSARTP